MRTSEDLHQLGLETLGAADEATQPAWDRPRAGGLRQVLSICLLSVGDGFGGIGLFLVAPLIAMTIGMNLGFGPGLFSFQHELAGVTEIVLAFVVAWVTGQRWGANRARLLFVLVGLLSVILCASGILIVGDPLVVVLVVVVGGALGGAQTLRLPLLFDSYGPVQRPRTFCALAGALALSASAACLVDCLFTDSFGWSWRPAILVLGAVAIVCTVLAVRLRDPGIGGEASRAVRGAVFEVEGVVPLEGTPARNGSAVENPEEADTTAVSISFFEGYRQILTVPSIPAALYLFVGFGLFSVTLQTYLVYFLEDRWALNTGHIELLLGLLFLAPLPVLAVLAVRGKGLGGSPISALQVSAIAGLVSSLFILPATYMPFLGVVIACLAVVYGAAFVVVPGAAIACLSVVRPELRVRAASLVATCVGVGTLVGPSLASAFYARFGTRIALLILAIAGVLLAVAALRRIKLVSADLNNAVEQVIDRDRHEARVLRGDSFPLLSCRQIDFSYGSIQVLFGVDLRIDEGEMIALLGTNGAGKSTLLRVVCGLGLPSRGTIRYEGNDITFLAPPARVALGISQIPGGKAVFGPMTVVENLRVYGYSLGRRRSYVEKRIELVFEDFPQLASKRNQQASTLSGGEQQMLGLAKAVILQPRLLAIDELSLGLAPIVTASLLEMVRRINAGGTSVLLVEQSVNVALSLVERAYFLEKGVVRFEGVARELLNRDDILRAVFFSRPDVDSADEDLSRPVQG